MSLSQASTAVLLFSLPDSIEAGRKVVVRHSVVRHSVSRQSSEVWRAMRTLTQAKVQASGLPLLNSTHLINHQGTFGEQLSAALQAAFAHGYEHIICIGNDCPDLSVVDLRRAASALTEGKLPIGADRRGGVYLAGFSRAKFDAQGISQLPWQTNQLADALRNYVSEQETIVADLPVRTDVNVRVDALAVQWAGQTGSRLLTLIRQALCWLTTSSFVTPPVCSHSVCFVLVSGRAPPRS